MTENEVAREVVDTAVIKNGITRVVNGLEE